MRASLPPESRHFRLQSLTGGVVAAVALFGESAVCNSGIVDLGGQTLIFDTFLTPQAATDLHHSITHLLGPTRCLVVNSHFHNDHVWGNQVFAAEAPILAGRRTRELMRSAGAGELEWFASHSAERLDALRARYETADQAEREELELWMGEYRGVVEALPQLTVCLPTITFEERLEIHGTRGAAELIAYAGGHTEQDTVLVLPQDGVVFMGDLLFVGCHPYLGDGDPWRLLQALRELSERQAAWYVPGHGPVGTVEDVRLEIEYVEHCIETAQRLVAGGPPDEARLAELTPPEPFAGWKVRSFYGSNLRFVCERLRVEGGMAEAA